LGEVILFVRNGTTLKQNKEGKGLPVTRIETISDEKIDPKKFLLPAK
jgi:type I restriction enzyme S subunit